MQLFYLNNLTPDIKQSAFDKEESQHIVKVLRMREGQRLEITNGKGDWFEVELTQAHEKKCAFDIIKHQKVEAPKSQLHIVVAPTKMNERLEWFLEKATEIGIQKISLALCDRSERRNLNIQRLTKILIAAMKQSKQYYLPELVDLKTLKEIVKNADEPQKFIAHCDEDLSKNQLKDLIKPQQNTIILIGPEGDFSPKEIELAKQHSFQACALGHTRLRTETAALVACHTFVLLRVC
jgi:16S rRNA (uracil1498-N3)-methyltransferase